MLLLENFRSKEYHLGAEGPARFQGGSASFWHCRPLAPCHDRPLKADTEPAAPEVGPTRSAVDRLSALSRDSIPQGHRGNQKRGLRCSNETMW